MKISCLPVLAVLLLSANGAAADGFRIDIPRGDAVRAIGGTTVGDLPVGGSGYIPAGFYGWCVEGSQLYVPLDTQLVDADSYDAFMEVTLLQGGQVALTSYEIDFPAVDFDYNLHFPTCRDLVEAGAISSPQGYEVATIDGTTSLSAWINAKSGRRPQLPKF